MHDFAYRVTYRRPPRFSTDHGWDKYATATTIEEAVAILARPFPVNVIEGAIDGDWDKRPGPVNGRMPWWSARRVAGRKRHEPVKAKSDANAPERAAIRRCAQSFTPAPAASGTGT